MMPILAIFSLAFPPLPLFAQATSKPAPTACEAMPQKHFDFGFGDWDLTWPGEKPVMWATAPTRSSALWNSCIVQENFSGGDSMHLRGTTLSGFDTNSGHWKPTWVDDEGGYVDFIGDFSSGQMILQRHPIREGAKILQRMVSKSIFSGPTDWSWEATRDGGKTWQGNWPIPCKS